jgi:hypothetical protein
MESANRIRLATPERNNRFVHFSGITNHPDIDWLGSIDLAQYSDALDHVDAVICSDEWILETRACIALCKLKGIPTFHVLDGVIRWKNLFENPRSLDPHQGAPFMQPLVSDVTFVMGEMQAAILRWLGNDNVIVTGLPRFATYPRLNCRVGSDTSPKLLVTSSNRPWYTESQKKQFIPAFTELISSLVELGSEKGFAVDGRLSPWVDWDSSQSSWLPPHPDLIDQLRNCTALITTPSTIAVEGMLLGIPTMIFDPWSDPVLIPSAWYLNNSCCLSQSIASLLSPSAQRASFQDGLRDQLINDSSKSVDLIISVMKRFILSRSIPDSTSFHASSKLSMPFTSTVLHEEWSLGSPQVRGLIETIPPLLYTIRQQSIAINTLTRRLNSSQRVANLAAGFVKLPIKLASYIRHAIAKFLSGRVTF